MMMMKMQRIPRMGKKKKKSQVRQSFKKQIKTTNRLEILDAGRQNLFGHAMGRDKLESLVVTSKLDGKRQRGIWRLAKLNNHVNNTKLM